MMESQEMYITLSRDDLASMSAATRDEILSWLIGGTAPSGPAYEAPAEGAVYEGVDLTGAADLTFRQVQTWMERAAEKTRRGLRVIAEQGSVIPAQALIDVGIENLPHFQSRTTIRTRTVTGRKDVFLLGWNDWREAADGQGRYAVTPITYQSLRRYFQLE